MSAFFSCIGGKNPLKKSKKKKGKEPEDRKRKPEPVPEKEDDEATPVVEEIKPEEALPVQKSPLQVNIENAKLRQVEKAQESHSKAEEPVSPLLKELHEKFQQRKDKSKVGADGDQSNILPEESQRESKPDNIAPAGEVAKQNLPKNFAKNAVPAVSSQDHEPELCLMRTRVTQMERENDRLKATIDELKDAKSTEVEESAKLMGKLRVEVDTLKKEKDDLLVEVETQRARAESYINANARSDQENDLDNAKGREEILEAIGHLDRVCSAYEPVVEKVEKIEEDLDRERKDEKLSERLEIIEGNRDKISDDVMGLLKSLQELECRIIRLEVSKDDEEAMEAISMKVVQRLSVAEEDHSSLTREVGALSHSYSDMELRLTQIEDQKNALSAQVEAYSAETAQLKQTIEDQMKMLNLQEGALTEASTFGAQKQEELKEVSSRYEKAAIQLKEEEEKYSRLEADMKDIRQKYQDLMERYRGVTADEVIEREDVNLVTMKVDEDIPIAISERFHKELYCDKWANAFEKLNTTFKRDEKKALQILMDFCTEVYLHCRRIARQQIDMVWSLLCNPTAAQVRGGLSRRTSTAKLPPPDSVPAVLRDLISEYRRKPSKEFVDHLYDDFLGQLDFEKSRHLRNVHEREVNEIKSYIRKCLELSWEMVVQQPPMYLQFKVRHGSEADNSKFNFYSHSGHKTDYLVWPALLRDENGPLLQKGVIQAIPDKP
ncbi:GRIP and coiled-coil domain-containing protein 2-like isoform X2 [Pecten maximus]|uniref:GRIP and coiled-coil domain-containing protein 2-like isoform X2 n=1 Tax=Pecten maximus TaxID=6579 RepID=UPI001458DBF7|nr:GRIP and coiled-coil domain-containing protein 2-like isoform X2 [Pecten maximus]